MTTEQLETPIHGMDSSLALIQNHHQAQQIHGKPGEPMTDLNISFKSKSYSDKEPSNLMFFGLPFGTLMESLLPILTRPASDYSSVLCVCTHSSSQLSNNLDTEPDMPHFSIAVATVMTRASCWLASASLWPEFLLASDRTVRWVVDGGSASW